MFSIFSYINALIYLIVITSFFFLDLSFYLKTALFFLATQLHYYIYKFTTDSSLGSLPRANFIVFFYLFFLVAPILQLGNSNVSYLVNTMRYDEEYAVFSILIVILFIFFFFIGENRFKMRMRCNESENKSFLGLREVLVLLLSLLVLYISKDYLIDAIKMGIYGVEVETNSSIHLLVTRVLAVFPILGLVFLSERKINLSWIFFFIVFLSITLIFHNHFTVKRNALGSTYLTIIAIFIPSLFFNFKRSLSCLFGILIILFPASSLLTHKVNEDFSSHNIVESITNHFYQLHYDSWPNVQAVMEITAREGFYYGGQLLGVIFFFIPRAYWESKPIGTGELIGDYLTTNYSMWFSNLSAPLPAEGYINFGVLGVMLFGYLFSKVFSSKLSLKVFLECKAFYLYLSFSIIFMLRGEMLSTFSYTFTTLITLYLSYKLLRKI